MTSRGLTITLRHRWLVILIGGLLLSMAGIVYAVYPFAHAAPSGPSSVTVSWGDSTALVKWQPVSGATSYRVTLIRTKDMGIMEQSKVPASQHVFDAQGIWPGQQYEVAVEAIDSSGSIGAPTVSASGQSTPISRSTYNGFLDTMNLAQGQIDTNLWDVRLGQDNPPNQGGTFINGQMHGHLEAGDTNGDQTFTSMRSRVPFDLSGGRTMTVHGEVDLKGDFHNWFAATLTSQAVGADQMADLVDRPVSSRATPMLQLFDDQNGLHLFELLPTSAVEIGAPYKGGYHTNNVRDEVVWKVSTSHVTVLIDGQTAFNAGLPQALPFTHGYLELMAEDYPGNGGGTVPPTACDAVMADCNIWHLDNWGFDAPGGQVQPATAVYYTAKCGPAPSREQTVVTFSECGRLDNTGGSGFLAARGQTASTTFTLPSTLNPSTLSGAGLAFDIRELTDPNRISVSVNGGAFTPIGYADSRTNSWQSYRVALNPAQLKAGANTVTFRDSHQGAWDTPQIANLQLETLSTSAYSAPHVPSEPAPIGTWQGGTGSGGGSSTPTPVPGNGTPTPAPTPKPVSINNAPCTVTINGQQQTGTCSGTFTPGK